MTDLERQLEQMVDDHEMVDILQALHDVCLTYRGGLTIHEAQSGRLRKRDVFSSLALMGLCHSLIEDTLEHLEG